MATWCACWLMVSVELEAELDVDETCRDEFIELDETDRDWISLWLRLLFSDREDDELVDDADDEHMACRPSFYWYKNKSNLSLIIDIGFCPCSTCQHLRKKILKNGFVPKKGVLTLHT